MTTHIDEWLNNPNCKSPDEDYAKFVLEYFRRPSWQKITFNPWMKQFRLFCIHDNEVYRCTTASRMGDIGITLDYFKENVYDKRVSVTDCSCWSNTPDGSLEVQESKLDRPKKIFSTFTEADNARLPLKEIITIEDFEKSVDYIIRQDGFQQIVNIYGFDNLPKADLHKEGYTVKLTSEGSYTVVAGQWVRSS
jgi:hypothetical protein